MCDTVFVWSLQRCDLFYFNSIPSVAPDFRLVVFPIANSACFAFDQFFFFESTV
jgi:hypothetical protein